MDIQSEIGNFPLLRVSKKIKRASKLVPQRKQWKLYIAVLILFDLFMTLLSFWLAYYFRFEILVGYYDTSTTISGPTYKFLFILLPIIWLMIFALNGLYVKDNLLGGSKGYSRVFRSAIEGFLIVVVITFIDPNLPFTRDWLLLICGFVFLFVSATRFVLGSVMISLRKHGFFLIPAVIVGANQEGRWLAEQLLNWEKSGLHLIGFVDNKTPATFPLFHDLVSLGSVDQLGEIIERYNIGEVILASSAFSTRDHLMDIFRKHSISDNVNIRMSSGLYEILTTGLTINEIASVPLVRVNKVRLSAADTMVKAALDCVLTVMLLVILSPMLLTVAFLVKISSPGPILYSRKVMGLNGKMFSVLKFRTMVINGEEVLDKYPELREEFNKTRKLRDDPRITKVGAILRKYSLDEFPQLINVLKREMSLVGPRMIPPSEMVMYKQFDMNLLTVLPGMTGLWQVSGRSDVSYEERVQFDMYYIRNWSIWLDLRILFQTIPVVLTGRGAY